MSDNNVVSITRSKLAEKLIQVDGQYLDYSDYPFMPGILDTPWQDLLLKCSRQIGKSVFDATVMITDALIGANLSPAEKFKPFKTLFLAPLQEQTLKFSNTRLGKMINFSPLVQESLCGPGDVQNVLQKIFKNGSECALSFAIDDPDRARGISADRVIYDEVQDMNWTAVVPVINECTSNSDLAWKVFTGTPKTTENAIEYKWQKSTQHEWVVKCTKCNKYDFINSEKNIGKWGPICKGCGGLLDMARGEWVPMNPSGQGDGFHVSAPMLLRNTRIPQRWKMNVLDKLNDPLISLSKFRNEVLGVSDSVGSRLVSLEDLKKLCKDYVIDEHPAPDLLRGVNREYIVAGIDWSGQGTDGSSYTVLFIWAPMVSDGRLKCLFYKIYPQGNPVESVDDICRICELYGVKLVCGDAGEGALANALLAKKLGAFRVHQLQYGMFKNPLEWNSKDRYLIDRTTAIDNFMMQLKNEAVMMPALDLAMPAFNHILAEYEETISSISAERKVWRHSPSAPDDALHAAVFGWIGFKIKTGQTGFYQ